jgi:protein involved in polysaccharide export with SLBB domain
MRALRRTAALLAQGRGGSAALCLALAAGLAGPGLAQTGAPALGGATAGTLAAPAGNFVISNAPAPGAQAMPFGAERGQGTQTDEPRPAAASSAVPPGRPASPTSPVNVPNMPNEFQRFVTAATGRNLPMFGEGYFSNGQTFAPLDRVPVPADYVLGPGDELYIRGWGNVDIDYRAVIDRTGQISIPRVGTIGVAGLKAGDVEGHLRTQIGRVFKGFSLNVTLGQLRSIQIFVVGQARQPGTYTVGSLSTLVNAVFASGGPGANGSMRRVQLRRGNAVATELDLYDFIVQGNKAKDMQLLPGDVIVYTPAGPRVAVLGAVDTAAVYELKPGGSSLAEVLALAGGNRVQANLKNAQLDRIDPENPKTPRRVLNVDLADAPLTLMRDGDMLTVFSAVAQFSNAVTLRGNVAAPLRYPYTPGMRISQLIPEREALITSDYYVRKNRLVQFTDRRSGVDPREAGRAVDSREAELTIRNLVDEPNWEYATVERLDADRISTRLLPFHLGKAVLLHDPSEDLALEPGDVVTIFSSKDIKGPQARVNRLVRVEGEIDRPGVYQLQPGETLRGLLTRAGGFTPQAYVYGLELTREETRQRQKENLSAAVARLEATLATQSARTAANRSGDAGSVAAVAANQAISQTALQAQVARLSRLEPNGRIALELEPTTSTIESLPDVPLENADRIAVPSRPAFVTVAGAVVNSNAFLWRPGRTVGDYVKLAGLDEAADINYAFVLRADGTVNHAASSRGFLSGSSLQSEPLFPGDSVVIPNQLDFETWGTALVRGLKDWSQILSNFGLSAAAIKTLRQ